MEEFTKFHFLFSFSFAHGPGPFNNDTGHLESANNKGWVLIHFDLITYSEDSLISLPRHNKQENENATLLCAR